MTQAEAAYVAGIVEGEGCLDFNRDGKYPRLRVEMSDIDVVERLNDLIGGNVRYVDRRSEGWKDTAALTVTKREEMEPILRAIRPWMGTRRGAKVDLLLASYVTDS